MASTGRRSSMKSTKSRKSSVLSMRSKLSVKEKEVTEDVVGVHDVLAAMAESVVFTQSYFEVPFVPDRVTETSYFRPKKPPREIFYRTTTLFVTSVPPPPERKRCNCQINCKPPGLIALYRCLSCGLFDTTGVCLFCNECFQYTHPWHRAPHIFTRLEEDETIEETMQVANRMAEVSRREVEGKQMKAHISQVRSLFEQVGDDEEIENKMHAIGRRSVALESKLMQLRKELQQDIEGSKDMVHNRDKKKKAQDLLIQSWEVMEKDLKQKRLDQQAQLALVSAANATVETSDHSILDVTSMDSSLTLPSTINPPQPPQLLITPPHHHAAAAMLIQRVYRGYSVRRVLSAYFALRTIRIFDPNAGRDYYFDTNTRAASWQPPLLLRRVDFDRLEYRIDPVVATPRWYLKTGCQRRRDNTISQRVVAAGVIQGFVRCVLARRRAMAQAMKVYRRIYDEEYQVYFYWHTVTKRSSWTKPRMLLTLEPPLFVPNASGDYDLYISCHNLQISSFDDSRYPPTEKNNDRGGSGRGVDSSVSGSSNGYYGDGIYTGLSSIGGSATSSVFDSNDSGGNVYGGYGNNGNGGYGGGNNVVSSKVDPRVNRERFVATS